MSIKQVLWSLDDNKEVNRSSLQSEEQLEIILEKNIGLLNEGWMIIGRQVSAKGGFIDLLAVDRAGDLIVIELKKDKTPREVTAQVLDYASCVSEYKIEDVAKVYNQYVNGKNDIGVAFKEKFGKEIDEENLCSNISSIIVATRMDDSTERIIKYLNGFNIPINVLFFDVFVLDGKKLLSRAWLIDYENTEVVHKEKEKKEWNGEFYVSFGHDDTRIWDDARKYGFISGGGGSWYSNTLKMLSKGDRVWVNIPSVGYVGVGIVESKTKLANDVMLKDDKNIFELSDRGTYMREHIADEDSEYIVKIDWVNTTNENHAVKEIGLFGNQNTVCRPTTDKWDYTVDRLKQLWDIS